MTGRRSSVREGNPLILTILICTITMFAVGFLVGWVVNGSVAKEGSGLVSRLKSLRLSGYKYISPLLVCDTSSDENSGTLSSLKEKIDNTVSKAKNDKKIDVVSVYFRDFNLGENLNVNPEEKFYPASLNKIPVMIAAFKMAESNGNLLDTQVEWSDSTDANEMQEIKPKEFLRRGNKYSLSNVIDKMIKYSDNNAFLLLAKQVKPEIFRATYQDLHIPIREDLNSPSDYMAAKDFSYFLRVLYNSTYLKKDYSERAMKLLSQVDFKEGLVAGVPSDIAVAHKFGIKTDYDQGRAVGRELHDCGIIYHSSNPYLLCVMTKNSSSLADAEAVIKEISALVYADVNRNYGR